MISCPDMLRTMLPTSPDSRHESSLRLASITSLIINVCVALLFALGVACSSSPSVEGAGASLSTLVFQVEQTDTDLVSASKTTETEIQSTSGRLGPLIGPMTCILGVMCGLLFTVLAIRLCRRPTLPDRGLAAIPARSLIVVAPLLRQIALSLAQLRVSRT